MTVFIVVVYDPNGAYPVRIPAVFATEQLAINYLEDGGFVHNDDPYFPWIRDDEGSLARIVCREVEGV